MRIRFENALAFSHSSLDVVGFKDLRLSSFEIVFRREVMGEIDALLRLISPYCMRYCINRQKKVIRINILGLTLICANTEGRLPLNVQITISERLKPKSYFADLGITKEGNRKWKDDKAN